MLKVQERLAQQHILDHFRNHNILIPKQFGFWAEHFSAQLMILVEYITKVGCSGEQTVACFCWMWNKPLIGCSTTVCTWNYRKPWSGKFTWLLAFSRSGVSACTQYPLSGADFHFWCSERCVLSPLLFSASQWHCQSYLMFSWLCSLMT